MLRPHFFRPRSNAIALTLLLACVVSAGWLTRRAYTAGGGAPAAKRPASLTATGAEARQRAAAAYGKVPLSFEANHGQTDSRVNFIARGPGYNLFLTPAEAVLVLQPAGGEQPAAAASGDEPQADKGDSLERRRQQRASAGRSTVLRMQLVGGRGSAAPARGDGELPGKVNYIFGSDPGQWRTNIPTYERVRYEQVYPGVDLVYYGNQQQLEYDFVVAPGADAGVINLNYEGAQSVRPDGQGGLVLKTPGGELRQHKPFIYQLRDDGTRKEIAGRYALRGERAVGFQVSKYDRRKPLIIDPVLSYLSFVNTRGRGFAIAVDPSGFAYITGSIDAGDQLPATPGAYQIAGGGFQDVFVTKLNQAGTGLVYSTYLGGNDDEDAYGIAVDPAGNAYVTGYAAGTFPVTPGAYQTAHASGLDAFVTKLNPTGSGLVYSTYYGGNHFEEGDAIVVDAEGNAHVIGQTQSINLPTTPGAAQTTNRGGTDGFVMSLNAAGSALRSSTYLGGGGFDFSIGIALDPDGNAYVVGQTGSLDFPTAGSLQQPSGFDRGVFKSTTSGSSWTLGRNGLTTGNVTALAVDPTNPSIVYAGTSGGVSKSTDAGANWAATGAGQVQGNVVTLAIDPTNASVVYAGTSVGAYKTTNGGASWSGVNTGLTINGGISLATVRGLAIDRNTPTTLYAAVVGGMFKSTNGGASWSLINTGLTSLSMFAVVIDPANSATVYALSSARVFKSTNGGTNWVGAFTGLPASTGYRALAIDPLQPSTLYVGGSVGIYKTTNGATSWSASNTNLLQPYTDNVGRLPFIDVLAIDPVTPTTLYAGALASFIQTGIFPLTAVFKSTDGGASWTAVTSGFSNLNNSVLAIAVNPANPAVVYSGLVGDFEAFVTKVSADGTAIPFSTYLGGARLDYATGVAADSFGNVHLTGLTSSANFPTAGALQPVLRGSGDAFVAKLSASNTLTFSTYLGGGRTEEGQGIALDPAGNIYVAGGTTSPDFPVTAGSFQTKIGNPGTVGNSDAFVARLDPSGAGLSYASYLGGAGQEAVSPFGLRLFNALAVDAFGNAYTVGITSDPNTFPAFDSLNQQSVFGATVTYVSKVSAAPPSYSITGRLLTGANAPIVNAVVEATTADGRFVRFATTDSSGYYELISLPPGDYTVTPFGSGAGLFGFSPAARTFTGLNADQTADFTGTRRFQIGGRVTGTPSGLGVAGVTVTVSGPVSATATTDRDGFYFFFGSVNGFPAGNYTVTPSKPGYTFNPVNQTLINLSADQNSINFTTPSAQFFNLTGRVATAANASVSGVSVVLPAPWNRFTTTDANGNYTFANLQADGSYTVIPMKPLLTFTPYNPTVSNLTGPTTLNFTAAPATGLTGKLAYTRFDVNGGDVFVANADGTGEVNVTNHPDYDDFPAWSPDGGKLAFISDRGDPVNFKDDIYTINADGTGLVRLTDNTANPNTLVEDGDPAWSPDGLKIAFENGTLDCSSSDVPVPSDVFTINADGSGRTRLTSNQILDSYPSWSPDATRLAFARALTTDCSSAEGDIWVMNADGSGQTQLTNNNFTGQAEPSPAWSPDGAKIAFVRAVELPGSYTEHIYVMNPDGTGVTDLTPSIPFAGHPTWSPDGSKLAFEAFLGNGPTQIFVMNADGTGLTQITSNAINGAFAPSWRPDPSLLPFANIGGRVADTNGVGLAGVQVTLGGSQSFTMTTDANGFYSTRNNNIPRGGSYTVTPALAGRTFSPASQTFNNLAGTARADFSSAAVTVAITGRVVDVDNPGAGLSGVTVTLSGSAGGSTTTDALGNYTFAGLAPGGNYTVTPARANYQFESPAQTFSNVTANQTADFVATLVYTISGRVTDVATGAGLAGVTVTVSGTRTVISATDPNGDYAVAVPAGGTYSVTAVSPYNVLAPPRADFPNLSAPQTANFVSVPAVVPSPTPPLSDNFNGPQRDAEKWSLGAVSVDPESVDPLVPVVQTAGRLQIVPRPNVDGEHFNGYVSVRPVDLTGGRASVEVAQTTTSTAQTIFGIGSDNQNNYRFVVTSLADAPPGVVAALARRGGWGKLTADMLVLVFQVRIAGVVTQEVVPYDPVQHRFWRFRHDPPVNAVLFETSADNSAYAERYRKSLDKSVSALAVELTAGTATPTTGGGTAIFDNLNLTTSAVQFRAATARAGEGSHSATVTVARTGSLAGAASVDYATADDPAPVPCDPSLRRPDGTPYPSGDAYARCDYSTVVGTLSFAPGEAEKTFAVPLIDDAFSEGEETFRVVLRNPTGAGLSAGAMVLTLGDDDGPQGGPNPIRSTPFFVRLHYLDFLGREPEVGEPWSRVLNQCPPGDTGCDRITVSAAFFGSPEFQLKGLYVFRFYKVAFNRLPQYDEIIPDMSFVAGATPEEVFRRRAELATLFTRRPEFAGAYGSLSNDAFVSALMGRYSLQQITTPDPASPDSGAKVTLARADLVSRIAAGTLTRAQVFRAIADSDEVGAREFNNAFVAMQYYGYLRRTPEPSGYEAWLRVINQDPNNIRIMVDGFMNSQEYALRFGKP